MRGFLDMSLGVMAYHLMAVFRKWPSNVLSIIEAIAFLYSLKVLNDGFCVEDFKVLVLFPVMIASTMTGKSIWAKLLNLRISSFAGTISYEIYLNHLMISTAITKFWKEKGYQKVMLIYIASIILLAIFMHCLLQFLQCIFHRYQKIKMEMY